jgi:hypothetical protein
MWAGDTAADRVLKGMTTEKWMLIEPKNVDAFQWPNRLSILMSGNAKWIVPASHDERRYAVNKINEKWKQNKTYFAPLFEEINNGGAAAMLTISYRLTWTAGIHVTTFHKPNPSRTEAARPYRT